MRNEFEFDPKSVPQTVLQEAIKRNKLQKELFRRRLRRGQELVIQFGPEKDDRAASLLEEPQVYRVLWSGPEGGGWPTESAEYVRCRFKSNNRQAMVWTFNVAEVGRAEHLLKDVFSLDFNIPRFGC